MKHYLKTIVVLLAVTAVLASCEKDPAAPKISGLEIGKDNSGIAYVGGDLHIEAEIVAEAKIARIVLTIHPEEEHAHHAPIQRVISISEHSTHWEVDTTYTGKYAGVKNIEFHEHIKVPLYAETGDYHLHLLVVDMDGKTAEVEEEFSVVEAPVEKAKSEK